MCEAPVLGIFCVVWIIDMGVEEGFTTRLIHVSNKQGTRTRIFNYLIYMIIFIKGCQLHS